MPSSPTVPRVWLAAVLGACALALALLAAAPAHAVQFKAGSSLPLGATFLGTTDTPVDVKLADVDGNGDPDMVALTQDSGVWAYGGGAGASFSVPGGSFSVGSSAPTIVPTSLCTGQFNGSGGADYLVTLSNGTVKVGLQSGGLAFASAASVASGLNGLTSCAVGDVDGDGDVDAVVGGSDGVKVLTNSGGTFSAGATLATTGVTGVGIGNFNGGNSDVAALTGSGVSVFLNTGGAGFGPAASVAIAGTTLSGLVVADFDGVNGADLAVGADNPGADYVRVRLGNGAGAFGADTAYSAAAAPRRLSQDDFNKDGVPDLLMSGATDGSLAVLQGTTAPRGGFNAPALIPGSKVIAAASANADTDGAPDVVTVNNSAVAPSSFSAGVWTNAPAGQFSPTILSFPVVTVITGAGSDLAASLTSLGVPNLTVTGTSITGNDAGSYTVIGDGCSGRSLAAGVSCQISIRFVPTHSGPNPATLTLLTDGPSNPTLTLVANGDTGPRPAAPANISLPTISGVAEQGKTLTCSPGTWSDPTATFDYFWARGGEGIPDASEQSYVIKYDDVGFNITCRAFANGGGGRVPAVSKPVVPVDKIKPTCTIKANDQNMPTVRSLGFQVTVTCSEPVTAKFSLTISKKDRKKYHLRSAKVGSDEQKYTAAGSNVNRVLLDATAKRKLKKAKKLKFTVTLTATDRVRLAAKSSKVTKTAK